MCLKLCLLILTGELPFSFCIFLLAFVCIFVLFVFLYLRGMCHKLCLLMLTGKLPVSSASSVSLARSVRGVIVASKEYLERNIQDYDLKSQKRQPVHFCQLPFA